MELFTNGTVFAVKSDFADKDTVKAAGFWWHGLVNCRAGCDACKAKLGKIWWTPKVEIAYKLRNFASPSQKEQLEAAFMKMDTQIAASRATDSDMVVPAPEGLSYLGYQKAGIAYALGRRNTLIADEMGLGKTVQTLGVINASPECRRVLCLARKSLRLNWADEARKWLVRPFEVVMPDTLGEFEKACNVELDALGLFVIVNAEKIKTQKWLELAMFVGWDLLIIDEAHDYKNPEAQRTRAVLGWVQKSKDARGRVVDRVCHEGIRHASARSMFLTGTPIENRPVEVHALVSALDEQFEGFNFLKRYCGAKQVQAGNKLVWDFSGATNLDELQSRLRSTIMVRRLKKDVLLDLPAKQREVIRLEPTAEMAELLSVEKKMATEIRLANYESQVADLAIASKRLDIDRLSTVRHDLGLLKAELVAEQVEQVLLQREKVILFCHHKDVVASLAAALAKHGVVTVTGDTKEEDRHAAVKAFQGPILEHGVRVFIGTIKAAGVGLTLTASSYVGMAELSYVPADVSQAEDRAHRIGQKDTVQVQHFVIDGSLDAIMAKMIIKKQAVADKALDTEPVVLKPDPNAGEEKFEISLPPAKVGDQRHKLAPERLRKLCHEGLRSLAGMCDGAVEKDGSGFNRFDSSLGKSLAASERLTDGQVWLAKKMLRKYAKQLGKDITDALLEAS